MTVLHLNSPDLECAGIGLSHGIAGGGTYQKGLGVTGGNKDSKS